MRKTTACAVLLVGALSTAGGAAQAEPIVDRAPAQQSVPDHQAIELNGIHFTIDREGGTLVLSAPEAGFETAGGTLVVRDTAGNFQDSLPLSYRTDDREYPIAAEIAEHTVRLTPSRTDAHVVADPITPAAIAHGQDITSAGAVSESFTPRDLTALVAYAQRVGIASVAGAAIGALVGGTLGCVAGAAVGSVSAAVTTLLGGVLPGAVVGCIAGVATVGTVGTLLGNALVLGPVVLWSSYQYFSTILAPCNGPGTYCVDPAAPAPAK
ncbi:hypothetical protein [Nocardia sp. alder85J]|uniref:hypothetical protein n=1 Tax=Nocardia sp. alder85J TaxID=2862949 RepID=UPI001CD6EE6E|nr:hypothetical protein [Nocardia sp. alder85J]MCX4094770.1 hypothetical protein [Nocardia sp. alder85J]